MKRYRKEGEGERRKERGGRRGVEYGEKSEGEGEGERERERDMETEEVVRQQ